MTKKITKWYCPECEILWNNLGYALDACPKCSSAKLEPVETDAPPMYGEDTAKNYIIKMLSQSDGYIVSDQKCWRCFAGDHFMIWPGKRDEKDYTIVTPLLLTPQCPLKVWEYADKTAFNITKEDFLRSLQVE